MKVTPEQYKNMGDQLQRIKRMQLGEWMRWVTNFWKDGYMTGYREAKEDDEEQGIIIPENIEAKIIGPDELLEVLLSVKGIGRNRAMQVVSILTGEKEKI